MKNPIDKTARRQLIIIQKIEGKKKKKKKKSKHNNLYPTSHWDRGHQGQDPQGEGQSSVTLGKQKSGVLGTRVPCL